MDGIVISYNFGNLWEIFRKNFFQMEFVVLLGSKQLEFEVEGCGIFSFIDCMLHALAAVIEDKQTSYKSPEAMAQGVPMPAI